MPISQIVTNSIAAGAVVADDLANSSVTTAKIADSAITTAKIAAGAVVTADLADGAVTRAKMGYAGAVLQVVSTAKTDTFSTAANLMTAVTGLSATITPSSTSSRILVLITMSVGTNYGGTSIMTGIRRNGNDIIFGQAAGSRKTVFMTDTGPNSNFQLSISMAFLDSPSSTSALTYAAAMGCQEGNSTTVFVNRSGNDPDSGFASRSASTITLMEIAG